MPIDEQIIFCRHCGLLFIYPSRQSYKSVEEFQKEFNEHAQKCMNQRYQEQLVLNKIKSYI